jgi:hypothetical protein
MSKTNINDFLVEGYRSAAPNGTVTSQERLQEVFRDVDNRALDRELDFQELDYKHLFERIMPKQVFDLFNSSGRIQSKEQLKPLKESAEAAIKASYFDQFLDRCVTRQLLQFTCDMAPTLLRSLVTRVDAPCSAYNDRKLCEFPMDPPPDLCGKSEEDEEPARFYQLGRQRCWTMPKPNYVSFSFALHRNLVCVDPTGEVRRQIEQRVRWFDIIDEKNAARLMFDIKGAGMCQYPYSYDGTTYSSGYKGAAAGAPWANVVEDADLKLNGCSEAPLCAIEQVYEDMRDPYNCFPLDCGNGFQVMLTRDCQKYPYLDMIAPKSVTRTLAGEDCDCAQVTDRTARDGWSTNPLMSRWVYDELVKFYKSGSYVDLGGTTRTYNDAQAAYAAANTYLVSKSMAETFGFMVDFDVSTRELSGTDTWQYFDRGVTWMRRYERKASYMWLRPWMTLLVRAFGTADPLA